MPEPVPFAALLAADLPRALRASVGWLGDEQDAREAVQDAVVRAWQARDAFDPTRPFGPWFYRIVRNACFDALDRRKVRRTGDPAALDSAVDPAPDALERMGVRDAQRALHAALALLPEHHREILVLRHFQDLTYAEIGQRLELADGTVMSRLYRARQALARALEGDEP